MGLLVVYAVSGEKLLQNNQPLWNFCFWSCRETALSLIWHNFPVSCGKSSDYADADFSKLRVSVSLHPFRCPVKRGKDISRNRNLFFASKWTRVGLNLCVFSEIYESETWGPQVDGNKRVLDSGLPLKRVGIFNTSLLYREFLK